MPYRNEKERIAYLSSLALLFTYAELFIPRLVPFFRLGLGNIAVLNAFSLSFPSFASLLFIKSLAAAVMSGTLFTPFVAVSLAQSAASGFFMYAAFHLNRIFKKKLFSVYGISVLGSALSAFTQIAASSLYLGRGTFLLLGPVLIFNCISGILTAFLSETLKIPENTPAVLREECMDVDRNCKTYASKNTRTVQSDEKKTSRVKNILLFFALLSAAGIFFIRSIPILSAVLVLSVAMQVILGRKFKILPHIALWAFVLATSFFTKDGRVLLSVWNFSITEGALFSGIEKAIKLSAAAALSQCAATIQTERKGLVSLSLSYHRALVRRFDAAEGTYIQRLRKTLGAEDLAF